MRIVKLLIGIAVCAVLAGCENAEGGEAKPNPTQNPYDIALFGPPANGVQEGRPFSVTLNFRHLGTSIPQKVHSYETITVGVANGPGMISGPLQRRGNGTSSLTFDNLVLSAQGTYVLQFSGLRASAAVLTNPFEVGAQLDLRFSFTPGSALRNRSFSVTVETVDPVTQQPKDPGYLMYVSMALNTGSGVLGGTLTRDISAGNSAVFNNLTYTRMETITLRAIAYGFSDALSGPIPVDAIRLEIKSAPTAVRVNGLFSVTLDVKSEQTGQPIHPTQGVSATIAAPAGGGALTGQTTATSSGATLSFPLLKYNQTGPAVFTITSPEAATITTPSINFDVGLLLAPTGSTTRAPGAPWQDFLFRVVDGMGAVWPHAVSALDWELSDVNGQPAQSGQVSFQAGIAAVQPAPVPIPGGYTLRGVITSPVALSATIGLTVSSLNLIHEPGPFVALKTVRQGDFFQDSVAYAVSSTANGFGVLAGTLPPGLTLSTTTGAITGIPTSSGSFEFSLYATLISGDAQRIRCAIAVFSPNESEIVAGQSFSAPGPHTYSAPHTETFSFVSSFDGIAYAEPNKAACRLSYVVPNSSTSPGRLPVFIHHRGRGFNMDDYGSLGAHIASYGFLYVSVEDYQSFLDAGGAGDAPVSSYDLYNPERGMQSASAFQEAVMEWLISRNSQVGHPLFNRVDPEKMFMGGHSRGGGATQASHARSRPYTSQGAEKLNINIRGVIYLMAYDLRYFLNTAGGNQHIYPIPTEHPRLPSLVLAAENDGDLAYPICDQFIDRATGPTTFATVYGACHNYLSDAKQPENNSNPYISRADQQARCFNLIIAFLKRWAHMDLSLEGLLYNNELAGSQAYAVTAYRNMGAAIWVDNHQDGVRTTNMLGGTNSLTQGAYENKNSYPSFGGFSTLGLRHAVLTLDGGAVASYRTTMPAGGPDVSRTRRFVARIGSVALGPPDGFDWVTVRVRLVDDQGDTSTVTLFDRHAPSGQWLPDHPGNGDNVFDRFVDISVPLSQFELNNPALTLSTLARIELVFDTASSAPSRQIRLDDIRFE